MKVYIAGASKEIVRAERWRNRLVGLGIEVTSTWIENIRKVGQANPKDATIEQYKAWALDGCLAEVRRADVLWLLLPECETIGAYIELGHAWTLGKVIMASGQHRPIFTPAMVAYHSPYDAEIVDYLRRRDKNHDAPYRIDGVSFATGDVP